jgi:hypothetical protein
MDSKTSFTASMLTLSGAVFGEMPHWDPVARSDAARRAGYRYIGAWSGEFMDSPDYGHTRAMTQGCPIGELEFYDLCLPGHDAMSAEIFRMADEFGATIVNVGITDSHCDIPRATLAAHLRTFATQAADHGLTVAVEPISFGLWSLDLISYLITSCSDLPNVGFLWDMFQTSYVMSHGHTSERWTLADIARDLPVAGIQLTGNGSNAMERHLWAGIRAQVPMVANMPVHVSVEITNRRLRTMAPTDVARVTMAAAHKIASMA